MTPLEQIEELYGQLVDHYGDGEQRELRAAAKLLVVALDKFRLHGGGDWPSMVREYLDIAIFKPEKLERLLEANRGESKAEFR